MVLQHACSAILDIPAPCVTEQQHITPLYIINNLVLLCTVRRGVLRFSNIPRRNWPPHDPVSDNKTGDNSLYSEESPVLSGHKGGRNMGAKGEWKTEVHVSRTAAYIVHGLVLPPLWYGCG